MANHKSSIKRIRSNDAKRLRNRYQLKSTRTMIKKLRAAKELAEATPLFKLAASMIDKLAKKGIIHKNNAGNKKSKLARLVNALAA